MGNLTPEQLAEFNNLIIQQGGFPFWGFAVLVPLILWSVVWKGFALWKAARRNEKWWFIPLLVVNLFGVLEILYIFVFSRKPPSHETQNGQPASPA